MKPVICWWSGGITSAVACKLAIEMFGVECCRVVFIDTYNESEDTYRFKVDCEQWYGKKIETISAIPDKYESIEMVWLKHLSLNVAHGAICSSELKREVRRKFQKNNEYSHQVFGFEHTKREFNRAKSLTLNHPDSCPIYPLLMFGLTKADCIDRVQEDGIEVPLSYQMGYQNNNCFKTGCVQGGIGYWQLIRKQEPNKFYRMAVMEHLLTDLRGEPVTMLKDQVGGGLMFLVPHPDYPEVIDISKKKGVEPKPLVECNGFCSTNDLNERNSTEQEINFQIELF